MKRTVKLKAYHISPRKNRDSILKNGLIPHSSNSGIIQYNPSLFFSIDTKNLGFDFVDYENVDCWVFHVEETIMKKDPFSGSSKHFYIEHVVDASKVRLFKSY